MTQSTRLLSPRLVARLAATSLLMFAAGCAHRVEPPTPPQPLPAATELSLRDFYRFPVGPKGLEPTDKLLGLKGRTVLVKGYLVKEEEPLPGLFMLVPTPVSLAELADGPSDYLPPATLFVHLPPTEARRYLRYEPGVWTVVGTLELGGREEANGRVSYTRLAVAGPASIRNPGGQSPALQDLPASSHGHGH